MCRAKISVSLLLILIFLAGVVAPVPECFVTGLLCPRAKAYACPAPVAKAPSDSRGGPHAVASCCAKQQKPQATQVRQVRHRLVELRSWMKPYAPEREVVEAPACPAALLVSLFYQPAPPDLNPIAVETLNPGKVPEPIPILLGKQSFLI